MGDDDVPASGRLSPTRFTPSGVRMRRHVQRPGQLNWLLLPGGPGIGSESLEELADLLDVAGSIWLVDLPGDGSNVSPPGLDPFALWPAVLAEAVDALPHCVFVGHSTGGMYLLSTPRLEEQLAGLALISSAPDTKWRQAFAKMAAAHPLPALEAATVAYEADRTDEGLRRMAVAAAEWNFPTPSLDLGRELLGRMPYNAAAVEWSDRNFDETYAAQWWPARLPTLILGGDQDRIVDQSLWDAPRFNAPNVTRRTINGAGHFPWIDNSEQVRQAFADWGARFLG